MDENRKNARNIFKFWKKADKTFSDSIEEAKDSYQEFAKMTENVVLLAKKMVEAHEFASWVYGKGYIWLGSKERANWGKFRCKLCNFYLWHQEVLDHFQGEHETIMVLYRLGYEKPNGY